MATKNLPAGYETWSRKRRSKYWATRREQRPREARAVQDAAKREQTRTGAIEAAAQLEFGDQRNMLTRLVADEPQRAGTINQTYDKIGTRLEDIAKGRQEGMTAMLAQLGGQFGAVNESIGSSNEEAQAALQAVGQTPGTADMNAVDSVSRANQQKRELGYQAGVSSAGVDELYKNVALNEFARGDEHSQHRARTNNLRDDLVELMGEVGAFKTKYGAEYDQADAMAAEADEKNAIDRERIAASERNNARSQQTKLDVTKLIGAEGLAKTLMIGQERGKSLATPKWFLQMLGLTAGKPKKKAAAKPKRKAKAKVKPRVYQAPPLTKEQKRRKGR